MATPGDDGPPPVEKAGGSAVEEEARAARSEGIALAVLLTALFLFLTVTVVGGRWSARELDVDRLPEREFDFRVDVNRANEMELLHLPGIGPTLAERIAADRARRGPFGKLSDLRRVKGIGPKLLERIAPYLATFPEQVGTETTAR